MKHNNVLYWSQAAMIAALYVALTLAFAPISYGQVQLRISEALTILPVFTPAAIPGLFVGCFLSNIIGGAAMPDILFGSLATLIGAWGTHRLRHAKPLLFPLPPIVANTLIVPLILRYAYAITLPLPLMMLTVGIGEVMACGVLGFVLYYALKRHSVALFHSDLFEHSNTH